MEDEVFDSVIRFVQHGLSLNPVIILGSGFSIPYGIPGMTELANYLREMLPKIIRPEDNDTWSQISKALENNSLEVTLQNIPVSPFLLENIIQGTWNCILPFDEKVLQEIIHNHLQISLTRLINYLFHSTNKRLSIITTNYDRLVEYATNIAGYSWTNGFSFGYLGQRNTTPNCYIFRNGSICRMVDIWKVHGSLDWFRSPDDTTSFLPSIKTLPDGFTPSIVSPGIEKYRRTHEEPFRTVISGADLSLETGNSFLCVGYGFNDEHIQPKLLERCRQQEKKIIILAKQLTESAKKVLLDGRCKNFIAFEECNNGTRIYTSDNLRGFEIEDKQLWNLDNLLALIL